MLLWLKNKLKKYVHSDVIIIEKETEKNMFIVMISLLKNKLTKYVHSDGIMTEK